MTTPCPHTYRHEGCPGCAEGLTAHLVPTCRTHGPMKLGQEMGKRSTWYCGTCGSIKTEAHDLEAF